MSVESFPEQILRNGGRKITSLQRRSPQCLQSPLIRLEEGQAPIGQLMLLTQLLNQRRYAPQMTPRQPREQMMLQLKLKPSEEPIHLTRTGDIDRPARLLLKPIVSFRRTDVYVCPEMVQAELYVLYGADAESDHHEEYPLVPVGEVRDQERKPSPEHKDPKDVQSPVGYLPIGKQQQERLEIEIDPPEAHDGIERQVLVTYEESRKGIECQLPLVELRGQRLEEFGRNGKDG